MYFNEKEDTNIDKEFSKKEKFDFEKYKKIIMIGGGALLAIILLIIIIAAIGKKTKYFLTLDGEDKITIYQGTTFNDPGYSAIDNKQNDLTDEVVVKSNLDTESIGTYTITYTLYNKSVSRTVNVIDKPNDPTSIHLKGEKNMTLKIGNQYEEPGYVAFDINDGDLTDKVYITGKIDTSKNGVYKKIYSVVNSEGVTTSETRTIVVE